MAPYRLCERDLHPDRIGGGVLHTLQDFYSWRDSHGARIASHVDMFTEQLARARTGGSETNSHEQQATRSDVVRLAAEVRERKAMIARLEPANRDQSDELESAGRIR